MRRYIEVAGGFDADLVERGVDLLMNGAIPGYEGRFAPTPPQLGTACRRAAEQRAHQRYIEDFSAPRLPAPMIEKTPEQQARARALVDQFVASQNPSKLEERSSDQATKDRLAKHDAFFASEFIPAEGVGRISKTLARKLGYEVGSPESDDAAA